MPTNLTSKETSQSLSSKSPQVVVPTLDLLMESPALLRDPHARSDRALVHVEPGASLDDPFHTCLPSVACRAYFTSPRGASSLKSLVFVLVRQQFVVPEALRHTVERAHLRLRVGHQSGPTSA